MKRVKGGSSLKSLVSMIKVQKSNFALQSEDLSASWCIDWVTLVGPEKSFKAMFDVVGNLPFPSEVEEVSGKHGYTQAMSLGGGLALFMWGGDIGSYWCFKLYGTGCQVLGSEGLLRFLSSAYALPSQIVEDKRKTVHCTRMDIACDLRGEAVSGFIDCVKASCEAGHMERVRSWVAMEPREAGEYKGRTVYCGSRTSPQFLRVYDKGLETSTESEGKWVRWEAQFNKFLANRICSSFVNRTDAGEGFNAFHYAHMAAAVVMFNSGGEYVHWYAQFIEASCGDAEVCRLSSAPVVKSVSSRLKWLNSAVIPSLGKVAAEIGAGLTPGQVLDILCESRGFADSVGEFDRDPIHAGLCKIVREYVEGIDEVPF